MTSCALTAPMTATHATTARSLSVTHAPPLVDPHRIPPHTKPTGWDADEITPLNTTALDRVAGAEVPGALLHLPLVRFQAICLPRDTAASDRVATRLPGEGRDLVHEVANILLDHEVQEVQQLGDLTFYSCDPDEEQEANWLAGCLLLPLTLLLRAARRGLDGPTIAEKFIVSEQMADFRLCARQAWSCRSREAASSHSQKSGRQAGATVHHNVATSRSSQGLFPRQACSRRQGLHRVWRSRPPMGHEKQRGRMWRRRAGRERRGSSCRLPFSGRRRGPRWSTGISRAIQGAAVSRSARPRPLAVAGLAASGAEVGPVRPRPSRRPDGARHAACPPAGGGAEPPAAMHRPSRRPCAPRGRRRSTTGSADPPARAS